MYTVGPDAKFIKCVSSDGQEFIMKTEIALKSGMLCLDYVFLAAESYVTFYVHVIWFYCVMRRRNIESFVQ